jgi:hypothetical protein
LNTHLIVLEQLAEEEERSCIEKMERYPTNESQKTPCGVIKRMLVVRDLYHLSFEHIGPKSKEMRELMIGSTKERRTGV